jgi:uncharacterized protein YhfF
MTPDLQAVLEQLRAEGMPIPEGKLCIATYGDSPEMSDELLQLITAGKKTATSSLEWSLKAAGEAPSGIGDIEIVVDCNARPAAITRIMESYVVPFDEVSPEHAALEGEGDGSLEYWRKVHWNFFSRECALLGRLPSTSMPVACVVFEVVHVVRSA